MTRTQAQIDQILSEDVDSVSLSGMSAMICNSEGESFRSGFGRRGAESRALSVDAVAAIASMTELLKNMG